MIQLDIWSRSRTKKTTRTKNPTPTPSVVRNPTLTPPKNIRLLTPPTRNPAWNSTQFFLLAD